MSSLLFSRLLLDLRKKYDTMMKHCAALCDESLLCRVLRDRKIAVLYAILIYALISDLVANMATEHGQEKGDLWRYGYLDSGHTLSGRARRSN